MIICPLNQAECPLTIAPKAKNVFIMSPSEPKSKLNKIIEEVKKTLIKQGFKYTVGASQTSIGDYFCGSICKNMIASPFGIAFSSIDIGQRTLSNIFMEHGLMLGLGKLVILMIDGISNLPSDFTRDFVVDYTKKNHLQTFEDILIKIKDFEDYYNKIGDIAFNVGDYEKASRYYRDAYLISGKDEKGRINRLLDVFKKKQMDCNAISRRIFENINSFLVFK